MSPTCTMSMTADAAQASPYAGPREYASSKSPSPTDTPLTLPPRRGAAPRHSRAQSAHTRRRSADLPHALLFPADDGLGHQSASAAAAAPAAPAPLPAAILCSRRSSDPPPPRRCRRRLEASGSLRAPPAPLDPPTHRGRWPLLWKELRPPPVPPAHPDEGLVLDRRSPGAAHLVVDVELVDVAAVHHQADVVRRHAHVHALELTRLKPIAIISFRQFR